MAIHNLGFRYDDITDYREGDYYADYDSEMNYQVFTAHPMTAVAYPGGIVAVDNENVGLVTYYGFDTKSERIVFIPDSADYVEGN